MQFFFHNIPCLKETMSPRTPDESPKHQPETNDPIDHTFRVIRSEEILGGQTEILIRHGSDIYRLRLTRSGKLILTK